MTTISKVDTLVVVVYMLLMVAVGVALSIFNKNDADFFKSGNKLPWWLSGISLFMTSFSVYTFTGGAGLAYRAASVGLLTYLTNCFGLALAVWFLASRWRRSRSDTVMSYLSERYGVSTNQLYSWTHMVIWIIQGGIMLLALGKFVSVAMGTPLNLTIAVCGGVIALYCLIGGLWGVVVTDTLQFMVLFPCCLVVMILSLFELGSFSRLVTDAPAGYWSVNTQEFSWPWLIAYGIMMTFAMSSGGAAQRYFSVKDEREARKVALITMLLLLVAPVIWLTPPIVSRIIGLDLSAVAMGQNAPHEAAYVAFCMKFLPHGAMGILLAAMLSATMSTLSANFNVMAGIVTEDIIKQLLWKKASPKALLFIGRVVTLLLGGLVITAAIVQSGVKGGVFKLMITLSGVCIVPAGIPIICGLFYRHTPWWGAMASYGAGLGIGLISLIFNREIPFTQEIYIVGGLSAVVYFVPGLFIQAKGKYKERLDAFFKKVTTPVQPGEVGDTQFTDAGSIRITGWTTVGMGVAAMFLALLDLPFIGRVINFSIAALMALMGVFVLVAARLIQGYKRRRA